VQRLVARLCTAARGAHASPRSCARPRSPSPRHSNDPPLRRPRPAGRSSSVFTIRQLPRGMETRLVRGAWGSGRRPPGCASACRSSPDRTSPLERGAGRRRLRDGISAAIEHARVSAINADLSVSVHRPLQASGWAWTVCRSTRTTVSAWPTRGLHDARGPIGRRCRAWSWRGATSEMGGPEMAPQTPQTFGAPRHSRGAPLNPPRSARPGTAGSLL